MTDRDMSQGETAYAQLLAAIRTGEFAPGDRLRETDVADRLNLSRTPVREALRRLEADGIVEHRPRLGAVIRQLSHAELVELYEMRIVLERTAAEMAAKHAAAAEIDALRDLNSAMSKGSPAEAAALNQDFHRGIYLATRNRFLLDAARALNNALMLMGPTTLADQQRIEVVTAQHDDILTAIAASDSAAAGEAAEAHLQTSLRYRLKVLAR
ncbi:GntR family transcriptional regulator [uncultured Tateyamaria sp.]|uniref:GntR family transcriptional regulator n=1 Tax=uncultured Tateyamaria sp. TaxID=455651 RepID=UPI001DD860E5|nr:GntR family transcriptional regulator [uncultured Tateyamaria sp.]MCB4379217.1 GntR family transcriptional regulator [Synechococcus sp. MU1644]